MDSKYYFKFETQKEKQYTMFRLIKLLSDHSQGKYLNLECFYNIFSAIYREELISVNKELPLENQIHWYNFDEMLKREPKDWFKVSDNDEEYKNWLDRTQKALLKKINTKPEKLEKEDLESLNYIYIKMLEQPIIHTSVLNICNKIVLTQEAEEYLAAYQDRGYDQQNVEQSVMAEIIKILRGSDDPLSYEIYNLIRSSVAAKDMYVNLATKRVRPHFLEEDEFLILVKKIKRLVKKTGSSLIERVITLFEELHDFKVGPANVKYCKVCGNPVWGDECVGGILCSTKLKLGEEQYGTYSIETGKVVYYLKDGIIRYNSIPGIEELWLYLKLIEKYKEYDFVKIGIYPGKDAEGDIEIFIGNYRIIVDLKGWRKSWLLEEKINSNASAFKNTNYLFVPVSLKQFYTKGLDGLNNTLKRNNLKTEAVSDRQFFRRIDDEINSYLNNKELKASIFECKQEQEQGSFL